MKRLEQSPKGGIENKGVKTVYVIRRSIYLIFIFFSILIMLVNCFLLVFGLCFKRLLLILDEGARPPPFINIAIMAEAGSTISVDAFAQAQNDLMIVKGFTESIMAAHSKKRNLQKDASQGQEESTLTPPKDEAKEQNVISTGNQEPIVAGASDEAINPDSEQYLLQTVVEQEMTPAKNPETPADAETQLVSADNNAVPDEGTDAAGQDSLKNDESGSDENSLPADALLDEITKSSDHQSEVEFIEIGFIHSFLKSGAKPAYLVEEPSEDYNVFYARPWVNSDEELEAMWSDELKHDFELCSDFLFLAKDLMGYPYENFPKVSGYIGFKSGGMCAYPAKRATFMQEDYKSDSYKCEEDDSGYFTPLCRQWFQFQQENVDKTTLTDLYIDASTGILLTTLCTSLQSPDTGEFLGAICMDIDVVQGFLSIRGDSDGQVDGPNIYNKPTIMQSGSALSLQHLGKSILRSEVKDWQITEQKQAFLYGGVEIDRGEFQVSSTTNTQDYSKLEGQLGYLFEGGAPQKVAFVFSYMDFSKIGMLANGFQFFIFTRMQFLDSIGEMLDHLFITVFRFWMPYLIMASLMYLSICAYMINYIATNLTEPFLELSRRIRLNVKNIQKRKTKSERDEHLGVSKNKASNYIELQVDLMRGYKDRNKENNELFKAFHAMAKILFVGHASSQSDFSYQAFFNLHSAAELLQNRGNLTGAGACYMIIAIKLTMQSEDTYRRAIQYMNRSEMLQKTKIEDMQQEIDKARDMEDANYDKFVEDKYILAFRQYTRAIISYNYFVKICNEAFHKYFSQEDKRIEYIRHYDLIGLDALEYFQNCLKSWPPQGDSPSVRGLIKSRSQHEHIRKKSVNGPEDKDGFLSGSPYVPPPSTSKKGSTDQKATAVDLEAGGHQFLLVQDREMGRQSFQDHCDQILLSPTHQEISMAEQIKLQVNNDSQQLTEAQGTFPFSQRSHTDSSDSSIVSNSNASFFQSQINQFMEGDIISPLGANLTSMRKIGGNDTGFLLTPNGPNESLDGFEDYTLLIRLMMAELKTLLYPIYAWMLLQKQQDSADSINGNGGQSAGSSCFSDEYQDSSSFSSADRDRSSFQRHLAANKINRRGSQDSDSDFLFAQSHQVAQDEKIKLYLRHLKDEGDEIGEEETAPASPDQDKIINVLSADLLSLSTKIDNYDSRRLRKIKRMGLTRIRKIYLEQRYFYLLGLQKMMFRSRKSDSYNEAILCLIKSLRLGNTQVNNQSKKTLLMINHILQAVYMKKMLEMNRLNLQIGQIKSQAVPENLPRRLTKQLNRKFSQQDSMREGIRKLSTTRKKSTMRQLEKKHQHSFAMASKMIVDDSMSQTSGHTTHMEGMENLQSRESILKLEKTERLNKSLFNLKRNLQWTKLQLSHHLVSHRSILFVLDSDFEHIKQYQLCKELIADTFHELDVEDFFGLVIHQKLRKNQTSLDIIMEEKGRNLSIKTQVLHKLLSQESEHHAGQTRNNYIKPQLQLALNQSAHVPQKTISYQGLQFKSPTKWVVAFIGELKGLLNIQGLKAAGTNLLIVFVTDEQPDRETVHSIQEAIREMCAQGGLMIIRYRETYDADFWHKGRDQIAKAFDRVKSCIAQYPCRNIPIIQEEFAL